ncbi:glyoxalase [Halobacteriovorax marinus]|uniref:Glyoxalase n=1 Tax=Halobacteriovorax marinus TaxID=97084 RepID=A0A1Y5F341_9BACT|nr:glyoxalase [Halobacteriovorax marinus]
MKMSYTVLGTNNMEASIRFYDSLFEHTELKQVLSNERMTYWQCEEFTFAIALPFNEEPATNGNGTMIGIDVGSSEEVKRLHRKAIELGGTCEGEPKKRGPFFSAYLRDLDKNKLCFFELSV